MALSSLKRLGPCSPSRIVLTSFILTILIGALLLSLPICQRVPISFIDALFTATSATCVTGLLTIPFSHFSTLGHVIILLLIQIGGLGLITMTLCLMSLFMNIGLATQLMAGQLLEIDSLKDIKRMLLFILSASVVIELLGAGIIFITIQPSYPGLQGAFYALFHAVASFCNGGLTLLGNNNLRSFSDNNIFLLVSSALILIGSIGFISWKEIMQRIWSKHTKLSLQTKLTLFSLSLLIIANFLTLWLLEGQTIFNGMPFLQKLSNCLFHAINSRGCGFNMLPMYILHKATLFMIMSVAFIGSAPGSTGSGIKTTTFAIFVATIRAVITGRPAVEIFRRRIAHDQIFKAMAVISLSIAWIEIITFLLLILEPQYAFIDILFEVVSAFATLGLSLGITASLGIISKCLLILTMFIGRLGSLSVLLALKYQKRPQDFSYPEERVMIS